MRPAERGVGRAQVDGTATPTGTPTSPLPGVDLPLVDGPLPLEQRVVLAIVVLTVGYYGSKVLIRLLGRPVARQFERQSVAQTVLRLVRAATFAATVLVALTVLRIPIGNLVLSAAVFSAVLGIVLAPIVGSVINGLFVLADQPFEIGDMVELEDGTRGFVEEMTIRYTKIITLDNTFAVIPNSNVHDQQVINYSAEDERTRVSLSFLATYESDIFRAQEVLERAARQVDIVVGGGPDIRIGSARYSAGPAAYIDEYADSGILITMRYWTTKPYKLLKLRSMVHENLVELLANEPTVEAAYPHQHLMFDDTSGVARVAVDDGVDGRDRAPTSGGATADGRSDGGTRRSNPDPGPDADPGRGPGA